MFPLNQKRQENVNIVFVNKTIHEHLITFEKKLVFYYHSTVTTCYDWFRDPYSSVAEIDNTLTLQEQKNRFKQGKTVD